MTDPELWLPVPGHEKYLVSELGRVSRLLAPARNSKGYMKVSLGRRHQVYVHQLVLLAFNGPPPAGHNVDHDDFDRANNVRSNLRYLPKPVNDFRWGRNPRESDIDPAELDRINAEYEAIEQGDQVTSWVGDAS